MHSKVISRTDFNKNKNIQRATFVLETISPYECRKRWELLYLSIIVSFQSIKCHFQADIRENGDFLIIPGTLSDLPHLVMNNHEVSEAPWSLHQSKRP